MPTTASAAISPALLFLGRIGAASGCELAQLPLVPAPAALEAAWAWVVVRSVVAASVELRRAPSVVQAHLEEVQVRCRVEERPEQVTPAQVQVVAVRILPAGQVLQRAQVLLRDSRH